jgi:hypothetical protein
MEYDESDLYFCVKDMDGVYVHKPIKLPDKNFKKVLYRTGGTEILLLNSSGDCYFFNMEEERVLRLWSRAPKDFWGEGEYLLEV